MGSKGDELLIQGRGLESVINLIAETGLAPGNQASSSVIGVMGNPTAPTLLSPSAQNSSVEPSISCTLGSKDSETIGVGSDSAEVFGTRKLKWVPKKNLPSGHGQQNNNNSRPPRNVVTVGSPFTEECKLQLVETEGDIIQLEGDEVLNTDDIKPVCLLGKFAGRFPGMWAVFQLVKSWKVNCRPEYIANGHIIFWFKKEEDRDDIVNKGPFLLFGKRLFLEYLPENFDLGFKDYCKLPIWIRLPELPKKCWHPKALSKIASKVGTPLYMDSFTLEQRFDKTARVLVEVDCSVEAVKSVTFNLPNDSICNQNIVYEFLPKYCSRCGSEIHHTISCPLTNVENNLRRRNDVSKLGDNPELLCDNIAENSGLGTATDQLIIAVPSTEANPGEPTLVSTPPAPPIQPICSLPQDSVDAVNLLSEKAVAIEPNTEKNDETLDEDGIDDWTEVRDRKNRKNKGIVTVFAAKKSKAKNKKSKKGKMPLDPAFFADLNKSPVPPGEKLLAGGGGGRAPTLGDQ